MTQHDPSVFAAHYRWLGAPLGTKGPAPIDLYTDGLCELADRAVASLIDAHPDEFQELLARECALHEMGRP